MPSSLQAWYSLHDLAALADRAAILTGDVEVAQLTRLVPLLHEGRDRSVALTLRFGHAPDGRVAMGLSFAVTLSVTCQRCLEPLECRLDETVDWIVTETDTPAAASGHDLLVLEDGRMRPAALLEDELIVALPMVPRHASIDECGALAQNLSRIPRDRDGERASRTLEVSLGD